MSELYFIAVQKSSSMAAVTETCTGTGGTPLAAVHRLDMPDLRVGTLDTLMAQSEILEKTDLQCETLVGKMGRLLHDLLMPDHLDKLNDGISANGVPIEDYVNNFRWDTAKFPSKMSLTALEESIQKSINNVDKAFKARSAQYNQAKSAVQLHDRKYKGTLVNKSLTGLIKKEHCVESEYLKTFFVVVPKSTKSEWLGSYENLVPFIVPKSSQQIAEDDDFVLFNVVCFQRVGEDLKIKCREKKFVIREFAFQEGDYEAGVNQRQELEEAESKQWGLLVRWTRINFAEAYSACVHVKALRLFVESVLRYSLPLDFCMAVIRPLQKKNDKKLRQALDKQFADGDAGLISETDKMSLGNVAGMASFMNGEFHPYVLIEGDNITRNKVIFN